VLVTSKRIENLLIGLLSGPVLAFGPWAHPAAAQPSTVVMAGDIAGTGTGDNLTANLINGLPNARVLTLGDNAYSDGTLTEFQNQYNPSWGAFVSRTFPILGNHDWNTSCADGYWKYFTGKGRSIGAYCKLWYSFDYGGWHFVAVNTETSIGNGSEQLTWIDGDLSANSKPCTAVYSHHPRFSSGSDHGSDSSLTDLWKVMQAHHVDLYLSGHDHNYERFAPQDASGKADPNGPVQWVVGTGGDSLRSMGTIQPNSVARAGNVYGILKLTLHVASYDWQFLPAQGYSFTDTGSATCVGVASSGACGIGPELAALLPLLAWRWGRKRELRPPASRT